jgi:DNA-binding IclR family transcriptional regulator
MSQYTNESQQRIIRILMMLVNTEEPMRVKEVARMMGSSEPIALRDLENLQEANMSQRTDEGKWTVGCGWLLFENQRVKCFLQKLERAL